MSVAFAISVLVHGEPADPTDLVDVVAALLPGTVRIDRAGNTVRFMAAQPSTLVDVAEPVVSWWQNQTPGAVLRFAGRDGSSEISYIAPEHAITFVRQLIETESGPISQQGQSDTTGPRRHRFWQRRSRSRFTAQLVGVSNENGILCVGIAEHSDGSGRSIILQGVDPSGEQVDLLEDDEGYCVVTETAATVYGGVTAIVLRGRVLQFRLTRAAAKQLNLPTKLTIRLDIAGRDIDQLGQGIRTVISYGSGHEPPPRLDVPTSR